MLFFASPCRDSYPDFLSLRGHKCQDMPEIVFPLLLGMEATVRGRAAWMGPRFPLSS